MIRTRIAPSPTGFMHIGTLRTALTNYLFAQKYSGEFLIRLEDTDRNRLVEGSAEDLIRSLKWSGIKWDEGIDLENNNQLIEKGGNGPYIQSKRLDIYQKYIRILLEKGLAYHCFCTPERLDNMRQAQQKKGEAPMYDKKCLKMPKSEVEERLRNKASHVVRLLVPQEGNTEFEDLIRGHMSFENKNIDDQVLIKSDGYPTYHFAVVVDDYLMKITHVLRGEEWLPSTPKHILLYKAFDWGKEMPQFGHVPQLLNMNGKKLSKRDGDVAVRDFIEKGYLPQAIINFIALLGWNPKGGSTQEIFSLAELVKEFDINKIQKAGAKFDYGRLNWFNNYYLKRLDNQKLNQKLEQGGFWNPLAVKGKLTEEKKNKILTIQKERMNTLSDISHNIDYLVIDEIEYDKSLLGWKSMKQEAIARNLKEAQKIIEKIPEDEFNLENLQSKLLEAAGESRGEFLWPLRAALTGQEKSPSPFECTWVLGKKESLKRITTAIDKIEEALRQD